MNALLAIIAGVSLNDGDMRLSYSQFNELFPEVASAEEPQADNSLREAYNYFNEHAYNDSYDFASEDVSLGYSIGIGKIGNLMSGELFNLSMIRGSIVSEHARLHLEYSMNSSEFTGDFLEGLFTIKNVLGFSAEFPFCGFTPKIYGNMRTRHLLSSGDENINLRLGAHAEYPFLGHFSVSLFYEHEWNLGNSEIDRGGLLFSFFY